MITDPWYADMVDLYGEHYCRLAGYFDEDRPFEGHYNRLVGLMCDRPTLQFSGAFYPFHEGHLEIVKTGAEYLFTRYGKRPQIIIHADHASYRESKGTYDYARYMDSFEILPKGLRSFYWWIVREDMMPNGCSRNFTRLYRELHLWNRDNPVWFLCGGDRARYALTFRDRGNCLVVGREDHELYQRYKYLDRQDNIVFLPGNNLASSTEIRAKHSNEN